MSQQLQVAVDGAQTDLGQTATDDLIKPGSSGMRCQFSKLIQDHLPLPGIALESLGGHRVSYRY
jgi:hypothetical protein